MVAGIMAVHGLPHPLRAQTANSRGQHQSPDNPLWGQEAILQDTVYALNPVSTPPEVKCMGPGTRSALSLSQ